MASTSYAPSSTQASSSSAPSVPPSITITGSTATSTTSNETFSTSPVFSSAVTYSGTTSVFDSSPQSMSSFSLYATTPTTSANASTYFASFTSQNSLYPQTSASPMQTSTTHEQAQTISSLPVSVVTSAVPEPTSSGGGALATYTHIGTNLRNDSFFNNRGAVIGTFVVVAICSTAIFACLCVAWRRRLQRRNHDMMFDTTITLPRDDPGRERIRAGPHGQPTMRMLSDSAVCFTPTYKGDALLHDIGAGEMFTESISTLAKGNTTNRTRPPHDCPLSNFAIDCTSRGSTGMAITENSRIDSPVPSLAPSTPSTYPPSLPPMETEGNVIGSMVHSTPVSMPSISAPPRPPRRRRPPPPPSRNLTEIVAMPSSPSTPASFVTAVPPTSSPSSISDDARTDSQPFSTTTASPVSEYSTNVRLERADTHFLRRTLVDVRDFTITIRVLTKMQHADASSRS
ncbi:hypothetical protein OG21DRAFT_52561 [Imleria badia]|nr:hypothetical protein OG21DRAFT_52561 [Imleria badia]